MIEKDYTLKITTKDAEANLNQLNSTLKEQNEILIELEKELLKVQEAQSKTSKTNLEGQRRLTKQADHLKNSIKDQKLGLKSLNLERREANTTLRDLNKTNTESINIRRGIDKLTGGLATKVIKLKKGFFSSIKVLKGFTTGLNLMQKALISTGIGAIAVGIGLIVAYWEDIKGFVSGTDVEQQKLLDTTQKTLETQEEQLKTTGAMENTLKMQGKSEKEIRDLKRQQTDEIIASTELLLQQQKDQKKSQIEAAERNQNITKGIIAFLTSPLVVLLGVVDGITNSLAKLGILDEGTNLVEGFLDFSSALLFDPKEIEEKGDETIAVTEKKLLELKNKRDGFLLQDKKDKEKKDKENKDAEKEKNDAEIKAAKEKAAALERIRKGLIDTEAEERAEKLRLIQEDYKEQIALAAQFYGTNSLKILELRAAQKAAIDAQQAEFDAEDKERQDKLDKEQKERDDKKLKDDEKIAKAKADLQNQLAGEVGNAISTIGSLFEEGTAASKASALAEIAIGTGMGFINALDIAQKSAKGTGPAAAFAFPIFYASQIAAVLGAVSQAKNILSTVKGGGGSGGSASAPSAGGTAPQIPAFNVVGASGETQLADAIGGQTQRPSRAYVVSSDVSTAQELDRNIIEGASIG